MNYQLIMLPNPILVSDEEIQEQCYVNRTGTDINFLALYVEEYPEYFKNCKRIIATIYPFPNIPSIDFSNLSTEDCKKIGWVDIINLAIKNGCSIQDISGYSFIKGFKAAQSLNEKRFSEEDLRKAFEAGWECKKNNGYKINDSYKKDYNSFINLLSQPKIFSVEIETDRVPNGWDIFPKITNNSIKILKVL